MKLNKKIIFKKNISKKEIEDLCKIKVEHWDYDLKSQINWWKKNSDEDYLIITLMSGKKKVAFLRIRRREIFIYNKPLKQWDVRNVKDIYLYNGDRLNLWGLILELNLNLHFFIKYIYHFFN